MNPQRITLAVSVLALVLAGPVAAQAPQPPIDHRGLTGDQRPVFLPDRPTEATATATSPDVALGQPGTAFRYVQTFGETAMPYLVDGQHLNAPDGLFVDGSNSLYVVEEAGHRLLKYSSSGANALTVGQAGQPWHHDQFLSSPKGVAVDASGNIWVTMDHGVKEFDSLGNPIRTIPDADPWNSGDDNNHFNQPRGIALDSAGRLFVADHYNHRVQVYSVTSGGPTYLTTIGVTGEPGSDNAHFNSPAEIVIDSSDRLYVADVENFRVQRCTFTTVWTCSTFHGTGTAGSGAGQLNWAYGLGIDSADNTIYIGDGLNGRVKKCNASGSCSIFITGLNWPADVALDSGGNVYVSAINDSTVRKYSSGGSFLGVFAGVTGVPYLTDSAHYNAPWGLAVAPDGSIYLAENRGFRLIKLNRNGVPQWSVGQPGVYGSDNAHFGSFWAGLEGNLTIDATGRVYVPDTGNNRIQVFNADGSYHRTFGSGGNGNNEFACPAGVAISPVNGDIFVVDHCNQRIQVYTSNWSYRTTLGVLDEIGTDNRHFNWPRGVAVDASGAVFVADSDNHRVQKCTLTPGNYSCTTIAGETGVFGDDFGHLHPIAVAVDTVGRVYVNDEWNTRVQVFNAEGAYLTTIAGGAWGGGSGWISDAVGLAVDRLGSVYVTDLDNHHIQKFSLGVPGWAQVNINGFGDRRSTGASTLEVFNGRLYAGAANWDDGARVWRTDDGHHWTQVSVPAFGSAYADNNAVIIDMAVFNGQLYASTGWHDDDDLGQVWRSPDGTNWTPVELEGFGSNGNHAMAAFAQFGGRLYIGTHNWNTGAEIWRSSTGNPGDWSRVVNAGLGDADNAIASFLYPFGGQLYATVVNERDGAQLWRSSDGATWTQAMVNGFGDPDNIHIGSLVEFGDRLYAATRNNVTGAQVWRSPDGTTWEQVVGDGYGQIANQKIESIFVFAGDIYTVPSNGLTGLQVWRSPDGTHWTAVNLDGFGNSNNTFTLWSVGTVVFQDRLFIGTWNYASGGEVWKYLDKRLYLPTLLKR